MRKFLRLFSIITAGIISAGALFADAPVNIIPERDMSIQFFSSSDFKEWPGVSGPAPIDSSGVSGRIWLVWPGCIINLDKQGRSDVYSLLTLFATEGEWGDEAWTAQNGVICSDGFWRGFVNHHSIQRDLLSGIAENRIINNDNMMGADPDSIYPASDGNLIIFSEGKAELVNINGEIRELKSRLPPVSLLSVSTESNLAAWKESGSNLLNIVDYEKGTTREIPIPAGIPWSMSWAGEGGDILVIGYPGELYALDFHVKDEGNAEDTGEEPVSYLWSNESIPERWYQIRGGDSYLLIRSPEEERIAILSPDATPAPQEVPPLSPDSPPSASLDAPPAEDIRNNFGDLLRRYTLDAGDKLVESGFPDQANRYYGWVMPYIRNFRSRYPLEEIWPNLESEITRRRSALR